MKSEKKCIIMLFTLVLVVTGIVFATSKVTAADTATVAPDSKETQVVVSSEVEKNSEGVPVLAGYIFAGWYQDAQAAQPYRNAVSEGEIAYAKFVPEEVLSVKAQLSAEVIPEGTTADQTSMRFITTVDTLKYREVGFQIAIQGITAPITQNTNKVYTSLYQIGEDGKKDEISPKMFCTASNYFCPVTMTKIPLAAWNTEITITPYWITLDGTTVYGVAATKSVDQGRKACVARIDSTYYPGVAEAVQAAKAANVIEVLRADTIDETITIDKKVTIKNAAGSSVTLTRGADLKDAVFTIAKTGNLAIQCAATGTITVDGAQVEATNSMIVNEGTFELGENAGLINGKIVATGETSNYGGALKNEKNANATFAGNVNNNTAPSGGAVYNYGGTVTVAGGEFKNNKADSTIVQDTYGRAGAIYTHMNGTTVIEGGTFENNSAGGKIGGGALGGTGTSVLEIKRGTFRQNRVTNKSGYGGGAIQSAGEVRISGGSFEGNTAYQGGAVYIAEGGKLTVTGGTFSGNQASAAAAGLGGGAITNNNGTMKISGVNVAFQNNSAPRGSAIFNTGKDSNIILENITCTQAVDSILKTVIFVNQSKTVQVAGTVVAEIGINGNASFISVTNNLGVNSDITVVILNGDKARTAVKFSSLDCMNNSAEYFKLSSWNPKLTLKKDETNYLLKTVISTQ